MKTATQIRTTHTVTLTPEEWFTVKARTGSDEVLNVYKLIAEDHENGIGDQIWDITLIGHRVLKDGRAGAERKWRSWEICSAFGPAARSAMWLALPEPVREHLKALGVDR